jgi:hypothetical protein
MLLRSNYTNENDESCVVIEICESENAPVLKRYLYYYNKELLKNDIMEESYKSGVEDLSDLLKLMYDLGVAGESVVFEKRNLFDVNI